MAIAQMQKVQVYALNNKLKALLLLLQQQELIEITNIDDGSAEESISGAVKQLAALESSLDFFNALFPKAKSFIENFIPMRREVSVRQKELILSNGKELAKLLKESQTIIAQRKEQESQQALLTGKLVEYGIYSHYQLPAQKIKKLKQVTPLIGYFDKVGFTAFCNRLSQLDKAELSLWQNCVYQIADQDDKNYYLTLFALPGSVAFLTQLLTDYGFSYVELPLDNQSYSKTLATLKKDLQKLELTMEKFTATLAKFYHKNQEFLEVWFDHLYNEGELGQLCSSLQETKQVALVEGWIVADNYKLLQELLRPLEKHTHLTIIPHTEDDSSPVELKNSFLGSPLEAVTKVYGLPNRNEFDPTPLLAGFFILFYGIALSDFGYGLMLVFLAIYLRTKFKRHLTKYGKQLLVLNTYCGVSTMVVGVLTGGYFGVQLESIAFAPVRNWMVSAQLVSPLDNPLPLLILSVVLGVAQIYTGLFIKFVKDIQRNGFKDAFLASGSWVWLATAIIAWVASAVLAWPAWAAVVAKNAFYVGIALLVLFQARHKTNPVMRLLSGTLSLYDLSGFVGDVLSYSRLFALGLATSVLAMVINLLASMTAGIPFLGPILMVLILIGGHIFNFLINILGAFVHAARLQYVEYFSKFFEGGGRFFKPFVAKNKYTVVK